MSLVRCPECGQPISDKATCCPHCGYVPEDPSESIASQEALESAETGLAIYADALELRVAPRDADVDVVAARMAQSDSRDMINFLMNLLPNANELLQDKTIWVARMTPEIKKDIRKGLIELVPKKDADGYYAILRKVEDKTIYEQVPIDPIDLSPQADRALSNLAMAAMTQQVLQELEEVKKSCARIQGEIRGDRLAHAKAAQEALLQADKIQDRALRSQAVMSAIERATVARDELCASFERNKNSVAESHGKLVAPKPIEFFTTQSADNDADNAFEDLAALMDAANVEVVGWLLLGETKPAYQALSQLKDFIVGAELNSRDTLLRIGSASSKEKIAQIDSMERQFKQVVSTINLVESGKEWEVLALPAVQEELPPSEDLEGESDVREG